MSVTFVRKNSPDTKKEDNRDRNTGKIDEL